jgi:ABC-2 type transport system ATP-binding protein
LSILQLHTISKKYDGHQALSDVSFSVHAGKILGLLGPNGAGKTTLLRILTQILSYDSGEILWHGKSLQYDDRLKIGYLPEERGLYKKMKVAEQLQYLASLRGMSKSDVKDAYERWSHKLGIDGWGNRPLEALSKGMQQKVQLVAALIHNPELLILDEPFTGFDPVNALEITNLIQELANNGMAIMIASHRMDSVQALCDEVVMLNESKVVLRGSIESLRRVHAPLSYVFNSRSTPILDERLKVISQVTIHGHIQTAVELSDDISAQDLLKKLVCENEILSFEERLPSMHDIFMSIVK